MKKALVCEKRGYLWLTTINGVKYVCKTTCKTWGCRACKGNVLNLAKMKMEFGILMSSGSWLTTLTYRNWDRRRSVDADCASKDFKLLIRLFQRVYGMKVEWLRVPEVTKRGMTHLHCLMSGLSGGLDDLNDIVEDLWYNITGDSYITDVRETYEAKRLANYLGKYLAKGFETRERLEELGFLRRYSSSRGWPKPEPLRLRGTVMDRWLRLERSNERLGDQGRALMESSQGAYLMERVGTDLAEELYGKQVAASELRKIERWRNVYKNQA